MTDSTAAMSASDHSSTCEKPMRRPRNVENATYTSSAKRMSQLQLAVNWIPNKRNRRIDCAPEGFPDGLNGGRRLPTCAATLVDQQRQDEVEHDQSDQQSADHRAHAPQVARDVSVFLAVRRKRPGRDFGAAARRRCHRNSCAAWGARRAPSWRAPGCLYGLGGFAVLLDSGVVCLGRRLGRAEAVA